MKKLLAALLLAAAAISPALAEGESMLPSGFKGDWCVTKEGTIASRDRLAYRAEDVGPCKGEFLGIGNTSIRVNKDECAIVDNLRTMLRTQLVRYTCRNGKKGFMEITFDGAVHSRHGLDSLYIDYAVDEDYWNDEEKALRPKDD